MLHDFEVINKDFPWFFQGVIFVLGAICGSFLNVCIYRIPKEESVISPRSHNHLGQPIAWYDNIPILSWFILRGRDRATGERYSFRYPFVEILTAVLFLAVWVMYPPLVALCYMVFIAMLICATFIDLDHMIIPDRFTIGGAVVGFVLSVLVPSLHEVDLDMFPFIASGIYSMIGVLIGSAMILWIALLSEMVLRRETMGFGDVKFLGCIGAFLGWQGGLCAIFGGALIGTFLVIPLLLVQKAFASQKKPSADEKEGQKLIGLQVPFGPMLAAGALLYIFTKPWVDAVLAEFHTNLFQNW